MTGAVVSNGWIAKYIGFAPGGKLAGANTPKAIGSR